MPLVIMLAGAEELALFSEWPKSKLVSCDANSGTVDVTEVVVIGLWF
jgi:hypothetical protein